MSSSCYECIDNTGATVYDIAMDELTIKQTEYVLGWSYPTAFKFAKQQGHYDGIRWYIPYTAVAGKVQEKVVAASKMQARLMTVSNGDS